MLCRYSLIVGNVSYELGDWCVKNWDEVSYSINRIDYGGVTRALTSEFHFFGIAYDILLEEYSRNYLLSEAIITVETVDDNHRFIEKLRYRLDFSKLSYDGQLLSIYAFDDSLSTLIKANKSTQYEYKVSELKESQPLFYDRLAMESKIEWIVGGGGKEQGVELICELKYNEIPVYIETSEIAVKGIIEVQDVSADAENNNHFFRNTSDKTLYLNIKWSSKVTFAAQTTGASSSLCIQQRNPSGELLNSDVLNKALTSDINFININVSNYKVYPGCDLRFFAIGNGRFLIQTYDSSSLSLSFVEKDKAVNVGIIKPINILNRLLRSINGDKDGITGEIITGVDPRLDNALIVPAESARGIAEANIYTSYTKFEKWMNVMFGYVPIIGSDNVTFVHRDSNFSQEFGIEFEDVNDFEYSVKDNLVYSLVRAGYDKKDYDSVNGRDEFRWTTDFNTGISITNNKMELISPYRADSYGIEFLVQKRGEDTTDSSSDNDVFFVCANLNEDATKYLLARSGYEISGVINADTMFNAMYSIRSILEANKRFLGISISNLKFASSEGNSDVVINGVGERDDFVIDKADRLFTAGEITFSSTIDAGEINLPKVGKLNKDGIMYEVYVLESKRKYGKYDGTSYKMCVKSMS